MLTNFHTHTVFCDGKNTAEEVVLAAIEKGFSAIGFSGHSNTPYDDRYCMQDEEGYLREINRLKLVYGEKIDIYLGMEEDAFVLVDRSKLDYIIGSCHYFCIDGVYYPIDSGLDYLEKCLEQFGGDTLRMAETYYRTFCEYILRRKPDIIGHFDLITKYDEQAAPMLLQDKRYHAIAEKYIAEAAKSGCVFEVNTGAMSKNYRTSPYPYENLLYVLKKLDAKLILSSDSHSAATLDYWFDEAKHYLREIGFRYLYSIKGKSFEKVSL